MVFFIGKSGRMNMKKLIFITVICALLSGKVFANFDSGKSVVTRTDGYYVHSFGGGEFTISTATLNTNAYSPYTKNQVAATDYDEGGVEEDMTRTFQTFCLETNEYVNPPHMVEQTIVNWNGTDSFAVHVESGVQVQDPIDPKTAYLYTMFATGALANPALTDATYDYEYFERKTDAQQLQTAIWYIEDEIDSPLTGKAEIWYNEAKYAVDTGAWVGIGNVRALNLWDNNDNELKQLQDQLYLVPVPAAVLLGILGLGIAGLKLRKLV
jgi:hypothetical protein